MLKVLLSTLSFPVLLSAEYCCCCRVVVVVIVVVVVVVVVAAAAVVVVVVAATAAEINHIRMSSSSVNARRFNMFKS